MFVILEELWTEREREGRKKEEEGRLIEGWDVREEDPIFHRRFWIRAMTRTGTPPSVVGAKGKNILREQEIIRLPSLVSFSARNNTLYPNLFSSLSHSLTRSLILFPFLCVYFCQPKRNVHTHSHTLDSHLFITREPNHHLALFLVSHIRSWNNKRQLNHSFLPSTATTVNSWSTGKSTRGEF